MAEKTVYEGDDPGGYYASREERPERDENGRLTLKGMHQVIEDGSSCHVPCPKTRGGTRLATKAEHLPSEALMAKGDSAAEERARANILARIEQANQELLLLNGPTLATDEDPTEPDPANPSRRRRKPQPEPPPTPPEGDPQK